MSNGKKIFFFFFLCLAALSLLGAVSCFIIERAWFLLPGIVAAGCLAYPKARELVRLINTPPDE